MTTRFFRIILYHIRNNQRLLILKERANRGGFLTFITSSGVLKFSRERVCRGLAVGMFWGFVPMPLQMAPATLFCWLARANLPVAITCVWISNPLTYVPIFFLEYKIGVWLFGSPTSVGMDDFSQSLSEGLFAMPLDALQKIFIPLLQGSIVVSIVSAVIGYLIGAVMFSYIKTKKRNMRAHSPKKKSQSHAPHSR